MAYRRRPNKPPPPPPDGSPSLAKPSTSKVVEDAARGVETERDIGYGFYELELFMKMNPPVFSGDEDDCEEAFDWLSDMEKLFEVAQFDDDRKVRFGIFMLKGRAEKWWLWKEKELITPVNWKGFRELFEAKFYSQFYCDTKLQEFWNLKQRNLSVNDYAKRFTKLSRFASYIDANEHLKAKHFEWGLQFNIRSAIEYRLLGTYKDVFETALLVEREQSLSQCQQPKNQKRKDRPGGSKRGDMPAKKQYMFTSGSPPLPDKSSNLLRSTSPSSTKVVAGVARGVERERHSDNEQKVLEQFLELNPPVFRGYCDPQEAFAWLSAIEGLFEVVQYDDRRKVQFGTFMLRGGANYWWTMKKEQLQAPVNWKGFCELFEADFYLQSYCDKKFAEFLNLKQRDLSVNDYAKRFADLSRFAPFMVANEYAEAKKFEMGLRPDIRSAVALFRHRTYEDVVETARVVERRQSSRGSENEGEIW